MKIYLDGELKTSKQIRMDDIDQVMVDIQIGKGKKREATDVVRFESDIPAEYGFDGLIDEVKIYQRALESEDVNSSYRSSVPDHSILTNPVRCFMLGQPVFT